MPYSKRALWDVMAEWEQNEVKAGVILVDETETDKNVSEDRMAVHKAQGGVLSDAVMYKWPIFVVKFGTAGWRSTFADCNEYGDILPQFIPKETKAYSKGFSETDGFTNEKLGQDVKESEIEHVIIMGQSVNACCAATARSAAKLGLTVHTSQFLVRGGGVRTEAIFLMDGSGWPLTTVVYESA